MADKKAPFKIRSFADSVGAEAAAAMDEQIVMLPIKTIFSFKGHPFHVDDDEEMKRLEASIRDNGVLEPGIARPRQEGGYECLAGHRRKRACERAGLTEMPFIIRDVDDEAATIIMVDTNKQREHILPSEKAKAYVMEYEAKRQQKKRGSGKLSLMEVAEGTGDSWKTVQRFIWLSRLADNLLEEVDEGRIPFIQGVSLSFLSPEEQSWVWRVMQITDCRISKPDAEELKRLSLSKQLTYDLVTEVLDKRERAQERKVVINERRIRQYFPEDYSCVQIEEVLYRLLDEWKKGNPCDEDQEG